MLALIPEATKQEVAQVWGSLLAFNEGQWAPALAAARARLATEASSSEAVAAKEPKESVEASLALRSRMVDWTLQGGDSRPLWTSLLFSFALMSSVAEKWKKFPGPGDQ